LTEEELEIKERSNGVRRQVEQLNNLKGKLEQAQRETSDRDRKEGLLKEARVAFDRYLRLYSKESKQLKRQKRDWHVQEKTELESFKQRWADFLVDEHDNADDIRPMLGLDSYDPAPKPYKLFSRYEVSKTLERNKLNLNTMFDREMQRVKSNKDNLRGFLMD